MVGLAEPVVHATYWCQLFLTVEEQKSYQPVQKTLQAKSAI
jgi:hypothetical protein